MLSSTDQAIVVSFAATGCAASMITRLFPAGFLLVFLETRRLDTSIGRHTIKECFIFFTLQLLFH